ncbi:MAG TPA: DUF6152 family protein [Vicinamibacterales bacterium]|nr:DUF6152 family protein [Vicinamibacterales bacterium]
MRRMVIAVVSIMIAGTSSTFAHHNVTQLYDAAKPVSLDGTVSAVQWRNPHVFLFVDAKDSDSTIVNWKVELLAGLTLDHEGIHRDVLKPGDPVSMTICVAKDGSHTAIAKYFFVPSVLENKRVGLCK